jgi:hypothetical protein
LDIFFRSGSRIQPEMAACFHGAEFSRASARTTEENSQVRMMSWPCGRRSNGNTLAKSSSSRLQPPTIFGVSEDVAQVSRMSASPVKPPGTSRWASSKPGAASAAGSTGSCSSDGTIGAS